MKRRGKHEILIPKHEANPNEESTKFKTVRFADWDFVLRAWFGFRNWDFVPFPGGG